LAEDWSSLLLGNGASIAVHEKFEYPTLHGVADERGLLAITAPIFAELGTTDFEHVLLACWYAERVNSALGSPSAAISAAYAEVRTALIQAVHGVHPVHATGPPEQMAVSVFTGLPDGAQQAFCHHVLKVARRFLPRTKVEFFDSRSQGFWRNP
jgi:hypothetical protein